jgi:hypothetical protein
MLVLGYDMVGKIGGKAVPAMNLTLIATKTLATGGDIAFVETNAYFTTHDYLVSKALEYLRDKNTARPFAELLQNLKNGRPIAAKDATMLPFARAVIDQKGVFSVFWDSLMTPEARAAMVRKVSIEAAAYFSAGKLEGAVESVVKDWKARTEFLDAVRISRSKAQHLLREARSADREELLAIIRSSDKVLERNYRLKEDVAKVWGGYLATVPISDAAAAILKDQSE